MPTRDERERRGRVPAAADRQPLPRAQAGSRSTRPAPDSERPSARSRWLTTDLDLPLDAFEPVPRSSRERLDREREYRDVEPRRRSAESGLGQSDTVTEPARRRPETAPSPPRRRAEPPSEPGRRRPEASARTDTSTRPARRRPARRDESRPPVRFQTESPPAPRGIPRRQQILLPFIALIAMVAGGAAAVAITNEPHTSSLQHEVSALQAQLNGTRQQLAALERTNASRSQMGRLSKSVAGLSRTVSGLQSSAGPLKTKVDGLLICMPQLQSELAGTTLRGRGKHASLVSTAALSPGCASMLGAP